MSSWAAGSMSARCSTTRAGSSIREDEDTSNAVKGILEAIFGTGGDEAISGILDLMTAGVPATTLRRSMPIHPTVSELIPTVLGDLVGGV